MRLNEATRSHVRGQSSPNLNLYILPLLALFHARDSHAEESLRNSRKTRRIEFHARTIKNSYATNFIFDFLFFLDQRGRKDSRILKKFSREKTGRNSNTMETCYYSGKIRQFCYFLRKIKETRGWKIEKQESYR